ncbi:MAG TPA: hypothetical protein VJY62_01320 [Bacteroidia bacterium]|nr:hypothetical protein [Bacteroidia bacterium]
MKKQILSSTGLMSLLLIAICLVTIQHANAQFWSLTGNTGTGSANFLGTTDNVSLKFRTNNILRLNITNTGKVGIGNFSPIFKLDVKGGSINTDSIYRISGAQVLNRNASNQVQVGDASAKIGIGTAAPTVALHVVSSSNNPATFDGGTSMYIGLNENGIYRGYIGSFSGNAEDVDFGTGNTNANGRLHLCIQSAPKLTVTTDGRIGIGTTQPQAKLQVTYASAANDPQIKVHQTNSDFARLSFSNNTTSNYWTLAGMSSATNSNARLNFYNSVYGDVMSLTGDGNVCIGAANPATGYKLSVNGKAICEEMKIQLNANWPDYVFDPSYKLLPLEEVEKFTNIHGYLPGIPSAAEVKTAGGFEVGTMQTLLLQKIEELTLHAIQQQKEINILKDAVNKNSVIKSK